MEENKTKIFWKPIDGGEFKELECVAESGGFEFEPLEEPVDVQYDPTPVAKEHSFSFDFDMDISSKQFQSIRKLCKNRLPRKFKKHYKNMIANLLGISPSKLKFKFM